MNAGEQAEVLRQRRQRVEAAWSGIDVAGPVLIPASLPIPIDGTDQFHEFHAHPEFQYLTGIAEPGAALAWERERGWTLFAPSLSVEDLVWMSAPPSAEALAEETGVGRSVDRSELAGWLESQRGGGLVLLGSRDIETRATEYGVDAWSTLEAVVDEDATDRLGKALAELRRAKDAVEMDRMTRAVDAAVEGHLAAQRLARHGLTERALQIEMEAEFFRQGGSRTAYGSIVGSGPNSAILHGTPGERVMSDGELVLIDAGAEVEGYASDVTRTFPVTASLSRQFSASCTTSYWPLSRRRLQRQDRVSSTSRCIYKPRRQSRRAWSKWASCEDRSMNLSRPMPTRCSSRMVWDTCWGCRRMTVAVISKVACPKIGLGSPICEPTYRYSRGMS